MCDESAGNNLAAGQVACRTLYAGPLTQER